MPLNKDTLLQGGKYKILRHISNGGFGVTYEAEHVLLHKQLAIKEFFVKDFCNRDDVTNHVTVGTKTKVQLVSRLKRKFIDEAASISSLSHPNIVNVTDVFEENGTAYYVMDYIDGKSLHQIVKERGALPEAEAVGYIRQIAEALRYVHSNNRLHLDIKPGNIMVDKSGKAMLIDFGASKQYDEVDGENTSTLMGKTPSYAPIEQMGNRVQTFSPATDIYSLGATLYKLLTGITPPDSTDLADDDSVLQPLPSSISAAVRSAVMKTMEVKRKNRQQSMDEFVGMLDKKEEPTIADTDSEDDDEETKFDVEEERKEVVIPNKKEEEIAKPKEKIVKPKEKKEESANNGKRHGMKVIVVCVAVIVITAGSGFFINRNSVTAYKTGGATDTAGISTVDSSYQTNFEYKNDKGEVTGYYTGTFINGRMNGKGVFVYKDGGKAEGTFKDDRIVSGKMTTAEKYYFEGTFNDGEPWNGVWYDPDGTKYSEVKDGKEQ